MNEISDEENPSLDHILRLSPFLTTSLFDIIEGSSILYTDLIELLIEKGVVEVSEIRKILMSASDYYRNKPETHLAKLTVEAVLKDFELYVASDLRTLRQRAREQRLEE